MKQVIIDSDIGDDITDAYALVFALRSNFDIKAIISNNGHEKDRATIIHKLVKASGKNISVFQGIHKGRGRLTNQKEFIKGYSCNIRKLKDNLVYFKRMFKKKIYYISLGTLSNIDFFMKNIPDFKKNANIIMMGGAIKKDYHGRDRHLAEWNLLCDIKSAQEVFNKQLNITLVGLDATWNLELSKDKVDKINNCDYILNQHLKRLYSIWKKSHKRLPIQYDSFTVALVNNPELASYKYYSLSVDDKGKTVVDKDGLKVKVAMNSYKRKFQKSFMDKMTM